MLMINFLPTIAGVVFHKSTGYWYAEIKVNGKRKVLGYRKNKEDAIMLRREAEIKYFKQED